MSGINPSTLDLILLLVLGLFAVAGLRRGLVLSMYDLVALGVILAVAASHYQQVGRLIGTRISAAPLLDDALGFLAILVVGELARMIGSGLVWAVFSPLFAASPLLRYLDRLGGLVPGLLRGALVVGFALALVRSVGVFPQVDAALAGSSVARAVLAGEVELGPLFSLSPPSFAGGFPLLSEPSPFFGGPATMVPRDATSAADPDDEAALLAMTNLARSQAGLPPLVADARLTQVARQHSQEMFATGYFAHDSPSLGDPAARLRRAGIPYQAAGENLAFAPTAEDAFRGLMESPEHRANLLSPSFHRVGIGVARSTLGGIMVTQDFTN